MPMFEDTVLSWPEAEAAFAARLGMTPEEFYALSEELRGTAWTISRIAEHQTMLRVTRKLQQLIDTGGTLYEFGKWINEGGAVVWSDAYTELVFRMATLGAYSQARWDEINDPDLGDEFGYLMYDAVNDDRTRADHAAMDGQTWRRDEFPDEFYPPSGFNCFASGTLVSGRAEQVFRYWYEGEIISIKTSGNGSVPILVTPNHPIATPTGWLAAKDLKCGSDVLACNINDGGVVAEDEENAPLAIEQLFEFATELGGIHSAAVGPDDFHGDVVGNNGKVEVASFPRMLRVGHFAKLAECLSNFVFSDTDGAVSTLGKADEPSIRRGSGPMSNHNTSNLQAFPDVVPRESKPLSDRGSRFTALVETLESFGVDTAGFTCDFLMDVLRVGYSQGSGVSGVVKNLLFACGTKLDSSIGKSTNNGVPANSASSNEIHSALSGLVQADEVVEVRRVPFAGHVYNLQTVDGLYTANGITAHNCRCEIRNLNEDLVQRAGGTMRSGSDDLPTVDDGDGGRRPATPDEGFRSNQARNYGDQLEDELAALRGELGG